MPPTARQLAHALAGNGPDAFQVVHIVAYGERDLLYLEDEQGHEAYAVAEHLARLWQPSCARLVVLEGGFSRHIAEHLLTHTSVEAVIGTRRKVMDDNALHFNAELYAGLAAGATVRAAYRAALSLLKSRADGQADRFEFVERDDGPDVTLPLPPPASNPGRPILADGLPRTITLPRL